MALRLRRGARRGRAARGGALAVAVYLGAGLVALSPALRHARSDLLGYGTPRAEAVTPGDHLQSAYNLWLPGHQLEHGRAPWTDPYSFQPEAPERTNFAGWPFAAVFWPLHALLGTVGAWNVFLVLTYLGAGLSAALWLRGLQLPQGAALAGGLAFALAPYRSAQTAGGHLLGPVSMLLPLALFGLETRRAWLAIAAIASIPLSGQVHLALGAIPFFVLYALVRRRFALGLAGATASALCGLLVYLVSIRGSVSAGGRSFAQVERYSAEPLDFLTRHSRHGFESLVFVGWLLPVLALAGLALVWRRDRGLAAVLGIGVLVPIVLALGANTPLYEPLWDLLPGLGHTRVPERFLPIACLALAALAAFAVAHLRWEWAAAAAVVLLAVDLRVEVYHPLGADESNDVYAALRAAPAPGRLLERPVYLPDRQEGSVYLYYAMQAPRGRPLGYSTTAPPEADRVARELQHGLEPARLGVRWVVEYRRGRPLRLLTSP
jgi:hypothetical protein